MTHSGFHGSLQENFICFSPVDKDYGLDFRLNTVGDYWPYKGKEPVFVRQ